MANRIKGEVTLEYEGEIYTLRLDFNALADFEDVAGVDNALAVLQDPDRLGAKRTRALFWCGLRQNHPEITEPEAGRILTANASKLGEALHAAFPQGGDEGNAKPAGKDRR